MGSFFGGHRPRLKAWPVLALFVLLPASFAAGFLSSFVFAPGLIRMRSGFTDWDSLPRISILLLLAALAVALFELLLRTIAKRRGWFEDSPKERFAGRVAIASCVALLGLYLMSLATIRAFAIMHVNNGAVIDLAKEAEGPEAVRRSAGELHISNYNFLLLAKDETYFKDGAPSHRYADEYDFDRSTTRYRCTDTLGRVVVVGTRDCDDASALARMLLDECARPTDDCSPYVCQFDRGGGTARRAYYSDGDPFVAEYSKHEGVDYVRVWYLFTAGGDMVWRRVYGVSLDGGGNVVYDACDQYSPEGVLECHYGKEDYHTKDDVDWHSAL